MSVWDASEDLNVLHEKSVACGEKFKKGLKDNLFTILTLIGVAIGFGIGFGVGTTNPSEVAITWISKFSFADFAKRLSIQFHYLLSLALSNLFALLSVVLNVFIFIILC